MINDGDEYWTTFSRTIRSWKDFGDRAKVRGWFVDFSARYNGFRPEGRWAQHFSIIAWPIAHAILPRDLQGQFARHLYETRYALASLGNSTVDELGKVLGKSLAIGSSRFENFLEQRKPDCTSSPFASR